jgi:hypothetical protein
MYTFLFVWGGGGVAVSNFVKGGSSVINRLACLKGDES